MSPGVGDRGRGHDRDESGPSGRSTVAHRLAARARRFGPLPFSVFMEAALYDEEGGFFASGGGAGRKADFVTSPEIGPLFAALLARALDAWWGDLGRPDPYLVVDAGAGPGSLARDVVAAGPDCLAALRYVLVERSPALREVEAARLPLELPALVLGPAEPAPTTDDEDGPVRRVPNAGPLLTALPALPAVPFTGVILANELLDNLPVDLVEYRHGRWHEVRVGAADAEGDALAEVLVPAPPDVVRQAERFATGDGPGLPDGARIPLQAEATTWIRQALAVVERGRVVVIDYCDRSPRLARRPWTEWLRTYRSHQPAGLPIENPGAGDITCEVAIDQLVAVAGGPTAERTQAEFLRAHGIDDLAGRARAEWHDRAHVGDLEALRARSRVHEADALCDAAGLGAFAVLEWELGRAG